MTAISGEKTLTSSDLHLPDELHAEPLPVPRGRRALRTAAWAALALGLLVFFTFLKFPVSRIKGTLHAHLANALAAQGVGLTAKEIRLSFGLGVTFEMEGITLSFPPPQAPVRIDRLVVRPSLMKLLIGRMGGGFQVESSGGELAGGFSFRQPNFSFDATASKLDLGKLGALAVAAGIQGSATVSGDLAFSGDLTSPSSLEGDADLKLADVRIAQQKIAGFPIPEIAVAAGRIDVAAAGGKIAIRKLELGKIGGADDLVAALTGDIALGKSWDASKLGLRARFQLSQNVLKALVVVDALLAPGKQADGFYEYQLGGTLGSPVPTPARK